QKSGSPAATVLEASAAKQPTPGQKTGSPSATVLEASAAKPPTAGQKSGSPSATLGSSSIAQRSKNARAPSRVRQCASAENALPSAAYHARWNVQPSSR